ncbi:hypothetical protein RRG08_024133 [Elysia crispata]|uniref:Uncharacterized protein n=1 Tax=Elysia crispata TaxID=231223 RepID=A0AAE1D2M1_9GAST|nr:hypothetical protein RRG08_024133 [Elysia crispata]
MTCAYSIFDLTLSRVGSMNPCSTCVCFPLRPSGISESARSEAGPGTPQVGPNGHQQLLQEVCPAHAHTHIHTQRTGRRAGRSREEREGLARQPPAFACYHDCFLKKEPSEDTDVCVTSGLFSNLSVVR